MPFNNLPISPQFSDLEEEVLSFWKSENIFGQSLEKNPKTPENTYVIYDGPPTANARPPLHTMVPMSFKDLVGRYKTMRGHYVPRQAGWDTHGLPVEVQVEKALGLSGKKEILNIVPGDEKASIQKFNTTCRDSVWTLKSEWDEFVPRVGYWVDTENPYITYTSDYIEKVWGVLKKIWDKGLVYKGYKVVPYCPRCGTALSANEVALEYQDVQTTSVYVRFPLLDVPNRYLLVWTTTPWTLPGNVAAAVGSDIEYVVAEQVEEDGSTKEYVLAKSRLEVLKGEYTVKETFKGKDLVGLRYKPPYSGVFDDVPGTKHRVFAADFVTTEDGSGIVHIAPMYGDDDFQLGQREGLPMAHTVDPDGRFNERVTDMELVYIGDALGTILTFLHDEGTLYKKQNIRHSYPHCWRCKTPLMYYAKDSWFISMSKVREQLVASNEGVDWIPENYKEGRFGVFIKEARDWAISRERFWGTPLPIWTNQETGDFICVGSYEELKQVAKDPEKIGTDFDPHRPSVDDIVLVKDGKEYQREPVVMDVWFDSGAMPYASGRHAKGQFPADYIAEATDQTRGWFYTLMAISTLLEGYSSYKRVVCMGFIVDETGKKMSKSLGNILDPWETFKKVGVDALRWFLYTVNSPGEPKALSLKEVQVGFRKSLLLVWNMTNYFITYANLNGFEAPTAGQIADVRAGKGGVTILDRWQLSRQDAVIEEVTGYLENYDFMRAGRTLEAYINDLSTWYVRRGRKRDDQVFFHVLYDSLVNVLTMMAPFTPFLTDYMYRALRTDEMPQSVHLADWPTSQGKVDSELEEEMASARSMIENGLSLRAAAKIKVRQPLASLTVSKSENPKELGQELLDIVADELNVIKVKYGETTELDTVLTDDLVLAGKSREVVRHLQQLRKDKGMLPQDIVMLLGDAHAKSLIEKIMLLDNTILKSINVTIDQDKSWSGQPDTTVDINGEVITVGIRPYVE